jgi:mRNA interferase MazF
LILILKPSASALSPLWLAVISVMLVTVLLLPLSFAYAIVRHQIIPVSLIIRRSVKYLLAKNGLRIILALPIIGLLVTILANPNRTLPEILFQNSIYFYLLMIAGSALIFRRRLSEWVDLLGRSDGMPTDCAVNLDHVQTVSKSKIGPLIATLSAGKLLEIRQGLLFALGF